MTACIIASSTAALTVTSNGCGTLSSTMSTPRSPSSVSRSSEIAELMRVLPARSSRPKPTSSSYVATTTSASRAARRASAVLNPVPGAWIFAFTVPGRRCTGSSAAATASPSTGLPATLLGRSKRSSGSANSMLSVNSRSSRVVRAWLRPPRTTVRAFER